MLDSQALVQKADCERGNPCGPDGRAAGTAPGALPRAALLLLCFLLPYLL